MCQREVAGGVDTVEEVRVERQERTVEESVLATRRATRSFRYSRAERLLSECQALAPASSTNSGMTHGARNKTSSPSHLDRSGLCTCQMSHGLNGCAAWAANTDTIAATRSSSSSGRRDTLGSPRPQFAGFTPVVTQPTRSWMLCTTALRSGVPEQCP